MNEIDYVNTTITFVSEIEAGTAYDTNYFTLGDVTPAPTKSDIIEDDVLRFLFWYRVFTFVDKCRCVKEVWSDRLYDTSMTYTENLQDLIDTYGLDVWVFCISFFDLFTRTYRSVYDEYRIRSPVLTQ
jgi:hypothetical protein